MLRESEQFVSDYLEETGGMVEIGEAIKLISNYRLTVFYDRKLDTLSRWDIQHDKIVELVICIFTATLVETMTMQALVGMLNHKIKLDNEIEQVEILADIIGLVSLTGLIDITSEIGEYHMVSTQYSLGEDIPVIGRHKTVRVPEVLKSNWTSNGSVILGHRMNHHKRYIRLSHINKMNSVACSLNQEFIGIYEEVPKTEPETRDQVNQWDTYARESTIRYAELGKEEFYGNHFYCVRGRCYNTSYYLSPQGTSFKKAIIELATKEVTNGF